jgi:DNA-binding response OmpR family regulator
MKSSEAEPTTIFLVECDNDTRQILKENLIRDGYGVIIALDEDDAMERVGDGCVNADLLLINLDETPDDVMHIARKLRLHANWNNQIPIIVIASEYPAELVGRDVAISATEYVTYLEDPDQLQKLLRQLLPRKSG